MQNSERWVNSILSESDKSEDITEAIMKILDDENLSIKLGKNTRNTLNDMFYWLESAREAEKGLELLLWK